MAQANNGDTVRIIYTGKLTDGVRFIREPRSA
jgi:FKBP-type peptidyl-prolyl cis-trans isomerase